ncbi:MAG: polysaccharide pyruvyl transferase family protein [Proteobacteria bacterium]|nr:polysaccharide pyruvyl transferase family protein [Pseudomonadota bacterium]
MKVGIITFHSSHNYGSMLQAFALQTVLNRSGIDAKIIDYRNPFNEEQYKLFRTNLYKKNPKHLVADIIRFNKKCRRYLAFWSFASKHYKLTDKTYYSNFEIENDLDNSWDAFICGSDQIWNSICTNGASPAYFLNFARALNAPKIAYAPSVGHSSIDQKYSLDFSNYINNIDFVSVRERTGVNIVNQFTDKPVINVLDPTLLLSGNSWSDLATEPVLKKSYIALYMLEQNDHLLDYAKNLSNNGKLEIVTFSNKRLIDNSICRNSADPCEFLGIIKNAQYVITNSFHATVFSILFKKQFAVFLTEHSGSRVSDFLDLVGLSDRIVKDGSNFNIAESIDYKATYESLGKEISHSREFLFNALKGQGTTPSNIRE